MVKYSTFYRIQERDKFFNSFCKRYIKTNDESLRESMEDTAFELMEVIVKMLLDDNLDDLVYILSKQNAKHARVFFDYFTGLKTKHMKKADIVSSVNEFFDQKEKDMKDIAAYLKETVKPVKLELKYKPFKLNEADDDGGDMGGDDAGGDDPFGDDAGGDDPFGDDAGGDDPFGDGGDDAGGDDSSGGDDDEEKDGDDEETEEDEYDIEGHEDDPEFKGVQKTGDVVKPAAAAACVVSIDEVMVALNAMINSLPDNQLAEIEAVKKAVTLIFNGKILKPEDVTFQNPKNAAFLIKKLSDNLNEKTRHYLVRKIKEPLIKLRDQNKEELAAMKNDTQNIRSTLSKMDM